MKPNPGGESGAMRQRDGYLCVKVKIPCLLPLRKKVAAMRNDTGNETTTLTRYLGYEVVALVQAANQAGVHYHLPPLSTAHNPMGRLMVWNHRDPDGQRIVEAMRVRRAEVAAFLRAHRPPPLTVSVAEMRFRRDVLHEPDDDLPLSEVPMLALRAIIAGFVLETLNAEQAAAEWRRERHRADEEETNPRVSSQREPRQTPTRKGWVEL